MSHYFFSIIAGVGDAMKLDLMGKDNEAKTKEEEEEEEEEAKEEEGGPSKSNSTPPVDGRFFLACVCVTSCTSLSPPPLSLSASPSTDGITRVAFVTAGHSSNYENLINEIKAQHDGCTRVQPVAMGSSTDTPTLDDYCCGIANLLKKGDCLVYIIWSGALETVNGGHNPPIKKLVSFLRDRPLLRKDGHGPVSVMHNLVLLQLGSLGTKEYLLTEVKSLLVFGEVSADDALFDAKKCAETICHRVKRSYHDNKHKLDRSKGYTNFSYVGRGVVKMGGSAGVEGVDNALRKSPHQSTNHLDAQDQEDIMGTQSSVSLDQKFDKLAAKFDNFATQTQDMHKDIANRVDGVGDAVNFMTEKMVDHQLDSSP